MSGLKGKLLKNLLKHEPSKIKELFKLNMINDIALLVEKNINNRYSSTKGFLHNFFLELEYDDDMIEYVNEKFEFPDTHAIVDWVKEKLQDEIEEKGGTIIW